MKRMRWIAALAAALLLLAALPAAALAGDEAEYCLVEMERSFIGGVPMDDGAWIMPQGENDLKALSAEGSAFGKGAETPLAPIALEGASALEIDSQFCGLILRPAAGEQVEVSYWGEAPEEFFCRAERGEAGAINLRLERAAAAKTYVNLHEERLYNVFILGIPSSVQSLKLDEGVGVCRLQGLDLKTVAGECEGGSVAVYAGALTGAYEIECEQGSVRLEADSINGKLDLHADQGWATVVAKEMTAEATLSTEQGWATIRADALTGRAALSAEQGWVTVEAGRMAGAKLSAQQGWVTVDADRIEDSLLIADEGWVTAEAGALSGVELRAPGGWPTLKADEIAGDVLVEGEWVNVELKKAPQNLRLNLHGFSTKGQGYGPFPGMEKLAEGSYAVGGASPVLDVTGEWGDIDIAR